MTGDGIARVLVIDDESQIRKFLRISLTAYGYELIEAVRGEDGIARCATESPDLVILDLGLPDLDGQAVIARIREWSRAPKPRRWRHSMPAPTTTSPSRSASMSCSRGYGQRCGVGVNRASRRRWSRSATS